MPGRTRTTTFSLKDLSVEIPKIFDQAQVSTANHQKNYVALYKLHLEAAQVTEPSDRGMSLKLIGERAFENVFMHMVTRILIIKKGVAPVDRIAKFIGGYTKFINEKASEEAATRGENAGGDDEDDESTASRYTANLLRFLFKGCAVKDKAVRHRVLQLIAEMISHLGEIDEDIYLSLRATLLDRIRDKEPSVRVQAVTSLSKLSGSEDPADLAKGEQTATDVLIDVLSYDPAPEVRRAALVNIARIPATLTAILSRTRDTDSTIRKLVYSTVLDPKSQEGDAAAVVHPRALSIAQREIIVRNGLGDRDESVQAAAERLIGIWAEIIKDNVEQPPENGDHAVEDDLVTFLKMFDLSEPKVAEDALRSVLSTQKTTFDKLSFDDTFWLSLNSEKTLLARVYVEHCIATKNDAKLESALPVVTALAFKIQTAYNELLEDIQAEEEERLLRSMAAEDENTSEREERKMDEELVIGEMLKLAVNLDYTDEIGRRKMFQLVRDMISQDILPEPLVALCLDVLRTLSTNERDLIRVVVEVVHDLRDPTDPDDDPPKLEDTESEYGGTPSTVKLVREARKRVAEESPEETTRAEAVDIRCLSLCIGMLERVNGKFEENSTLEGILRELILPAVKSKELVLREKGLVCLGLCCLIARRMALGSFQLLIGEIQNSPEVIKLPVLQIVFDILMVHEGEFLGKRDETADNILKFLLNILGREDSPKMQALISTGIAKLMLSGIISDERALTGLVMVYLSPATTDNHELRQALSYFFPLYCYSSSINQRCMQKIFIPSFEKLSRIRQDLDEEDKMISLAQVGNIFVDWTDPQKTLDMHGQEPDDVLHFDLGSDIVKALFKKEMSKEDKKALCQLLGKLYLPDKIDDYKLRCLMVLMHNLNSRRPLRDAVAKNAFIRFNAVVSKKYERQLEDFNEEEYRKLAELKDLFEFLDDIIPDDDEEIEIDEPKKAKSTRKRRSGSVVSNGTDTVSASSRPSISKGKTKKRRISTSDDDSISADEQAEGGHSPTPSLPTRTLPGRAVKKAIEVIEVSDDDDDFTPQQPSRKLGAGTYKVKKEDHSDTPKQRKNGQQPDRSSRGSPTFVESSDEEEMDEVDDLLAED